MKNHFITGTLVLIVILSCGIFFKADSDVKIIIAPNETKIPVNHKFKVAVRVDCENQAHKSLIEDTIKQELRSIKNIQIVDFSYKYPSWDFAIFFVLAEIPKQDTKINMYAYSAGTYHKVPIKNIVPLWQDYYREEPAILIPRHFTGYSSYADLEYSAREIVTDFDKTLQGIRESIREGLKGNR